MGRACAHARPLPSFLMYVYDTCMYVCVSTYAHTYIHISVHMYKMCVLVCVCNLFIYTLNKVPWGSKAANF